MPYCPNCGTRHDDAQKFCGSCGKPLPPPEPVESFEYYDEQWQIENRQREKEAARVYIEQHNSLSGNYLLGFIGALLGGLIGALPWGLVASQGWFVGWLGFLIAFLASKGYDLMKVKRNMNKLWCVIIAVIIGVLFGQIVSDAISIAMDDEVRGEFVSIFIYYKEHFFQYLKVNAANLGMGYLFAALGGFSVIRDIKNENKRLKEMQDKLSSPIEY